MSEPTRKTLFEMGGVPNITEALPLALQHVFTMVVGCITPAIIICAAVHVSNEETMMLIQASLVAAAIATFIQIYPLGGRIGAGIPVIMGISFAYVPVLTMIGTKMGIPAILGAQIVGGIVAIVIGLIIGRLRSLFPPLVSGTVVLTIGLSLIPVVLHWMSGGADSLLGGSTTEWGIAIFTFTVVLFFSHFTQGFTKLSAVLLGMAAGYAFAVTLGMVSFDSIHAAKAFQLPQVLHFKPEFQAAAIIPMVVMHIVNSVQAVGDITATTAGGLKRQPTERELSGGVMGNGLSSIIGALFGGFPTATFSQNVGIVTVTKVVNKVVIAIAAVIILLAGLLPKFSAVILTIPLPVLGGATVIAFAAVSMTGIKLICIAGPTLRNFAVALISVVLGLGLPHAIHAFGVTGIPALVQDIFGTSPVVVAAIVAVILNLVIPNKKK